MASEKLKMGVLMPDTLRRSSAKAQRTYAHTLKSAQEQYGSGERASRTALASLKQGYEKVDDHWVKKKKNGPSDPRARQSGAAARDGRGEALGGVDLYGHTKEALYERARKLGIAGRSTMRKLELARAIGKKQG